MGPSVPRARYCADVSEENVKLVRHLYESGLIDRDPEELLELATPDVEYVNPPYAVEPGVRHGLVEVAQAMRRFAEPWEESRHELRELYDCGDAVVASVRWHIRNRGSETELVNEEAHTWTLRAGRIARYEWGQDLAMALDAAGASDSSNPAFASETDDRVVPAGADEVPQVASLLGDFHDHIGKARPPAEELEDSVRHVMDGPDGEFLLGFADGEPAGFAQLRWRWAVWTRALDGWLEDLFVVEERRRSGLGRELVKAVKERARERGCVRLELDVDDDNEPALALYRSLGFSDEPKGPGGSRLMGTRVDGA